MNAYDTLLSIILTIARYLLTLKAISFILLHYSYSYTHIQFNISCNNNKIFKVLSDEKGFRHLLPFFLLLLTISTPFSNVFFSRDICFHVIWWVTRVCLRASKQKKERLITQFFVTLSTNRDSLSNMCGSSLKRITIPIANLLIELIDVD